MLLHSPTLRLTAFLSGVTGLVFVTLICLLYIPARTIELIGLDDKTAHFGLFAILTLAGLFLACRYRVGPLVMALQVAALALFTEIVQQTIPGRDFEFADIVMNLLGVAVAYGLFMRTPTFAAANRSRLR